MRSVSIFIVVLLLTACSKKKDPYPVEMIINGNMEGGNLAPQEWVNPFVNGFSSSWTTDESVSKSHSLLLSRSTPANSTDFALWRQSIVKNIPAGKDITLTVKIKSLNLSGQGVAIAMRGDGASTPDLQFVTTQNKTSISGTFNWETYTVTLVNVSSEVKTLWVYLLLLPDTTGSVYFDDVSLRSKS